MILSTATGPRAAGFIGAAVGQMLRDGLARKVAVIARPGQIRAQSMSPSGEPSLVDGEEIIGTYAPAPGVERMVQVDVAAYRGVVIWDELKNKFRRPKGGRGRRRHEPTRSRLGGLGEGG